MKNLIKKFIKKTLLVEDAMPLFQKNNIKLNKGVQFNLYQFNKQNKNKIIYIIKRSPGAGLFSNVIYVLNHLEIADKNGFYPIVDMKNFTTIYNEKLKISDTYNAWEYYFDNVSKLKLNEAYKSKNVIITNDKFFKNFSNIVANKKFRKLGKKYFKIKKKFIEEANKFCKEKLKDKTLAIHYRGTSYKTSANHPFPSTHSQTIKYTKYLLKKYKYKKIFLCTEDLGFFKEMHNSFKKNLYFINTYRSKKNDAFKIFPRKNHRYNLGKEILLEALIISKCEGFLHTKTNVSEFVKFLDEKNKIKYFTLYNGFNTSNEYLAPYMWHYKNLAPKFLGGFKK